MCMIGARRTLKHRDAKGAAAEKRAPGRDRLRLHADVGLGKCQALDENSRHSKD